RKEEQESAMAPLLQRARRRSRGRRRAPGARTDYPIPILLAFFASWRFIPSSSSMGTTAAGRPPSDLVIDDDRALTHRPDAALDDGAVLGMRKVGLQRGPVGEAHHEADVVAGGALAEVHAAAHIQDAGDLLLQREKPLAQRLFLLRGGL